MAEEKKPKNRSEGPPRQEDGRRAERPHRSAPRGLPKPSGIPAPPFGICDPLRPASRPKLDPSNPYAAISADQTPRFVRSRPGDQDRDERRGGRRPDEGPHQDGRAGRDHGGHRRLPRLRPRRQRRARQVRRGGGFGRRGPGQGRRRRGQRKIDDLAEVLKSAQAKLKDNKYPDEEVQKLGGIDIPFSGANLAGKGIGRFKPEVVLMLITFASGAPKANDGKNKIRNILAGAKATPSRTSSPSRPSRRCAGACTSRPGRADPGSACSRLPDCVPGQGNGQGQGQELTSGRTISRSPRAGRRSRSSATSSGDPTKAKSGEPYIVPVNPDTQALVCPSDVVVNAPARAARFRGCAPR